MGRGEERRGRGDLGARTRGVTQEYEFIILAAEISEISTCMGLSRYRRKREVGTGAATTQLKKRGRSV